MFEKVVEMYLDVLRDKDFFPLDTYADDPDTYMTPFSIEIVNNLKSVLESNNIELRISHTQDAFFSIGLSAKWDVKDHSGKVSYTWHATVRFSDFGQLFTILGNNHVLPNIKVIKYLEKQGFIYIPKEILELPYEGRNKEALDRYSLERKHTWFNRYFDYI
jgi:hypothetical protein